MQASSSLTRYNINHVTGTTQAQQAKFSQFISISSIILISANEDQRWSYRLYIPSFYRATFVLHGLPHSVSAPWNQGDLQLY